MTNDEVNVTCSNCNNTGRVNNISGTTSCDRCKFTREKRLKELHDIAEIKELKVKIDALEAKLAEVSKDAERYNYLKSRLFKCNQFNWFIEQFKLDGTPSLTSRTLDAAINEAIKKDKQ